MNFLYSKRIWLNEDHLPSTGSVVAYHGDIAYPDGVDKAVAFLEISDCHGKVRLHFTPTDSMDQFVKKMETLRGVIDDFILHLRPTDKAPIEETTMLHRPDQTFPVQTRDHKGGRIDKGPYMLAYEVYSCVYGPQKALIEGNCRGGFSTCELIAFLYARSFPKNEWRQRVEEVFSNQENI